jgi:WD40 repeat protein
MTVAGTARTFPRRWAGLVLGVVASWSVPGHADGFGEPGHAILRIETGMHTGTINHVVRYGNGLLTVSDDKTMRHWSLPDGRADGLWRVPVGDGDAGALYAVAVNGNTAVVGGRVGETRFGLYFFDLAANRLLGTIDGFVAPISALSFAEGGALLAVGLQDGAGLEVVDVKSHKVVAVDHDYAGTVNWLAFSAERKLASSSADGKIRLYGSNYAHPEQVQAVPAGDIPWGLAFSPDGTMLAVGSAAKAQVGLYLAEHLQRVSVMNGAPGASGALSVIAWNADGSELAAGGQYKGGVDRNLIRFWPMAGGKIETADVVVAPDTVTDLAFLPDNTVAYASAQGGFGVFGFDGRVRLSRESDMCDFRDVAQAGFAVSADGRVVDFTCRHGGRDGLRADLSSLTLARDAAARADLAPPRPTAPGLDLGSWRNAGAVALNGRPIDLVPFEHVRSVAAVPGQAAMVLGTDFYLRLEQAGREAWRRAMPAPAWGVDVSADGRRIVAALGDGTIRWYDLAAGGSEIASLFVDAREHRWVLWVPEGFFEEGGGSAASPLFGFQFNQGPGKAPDFVPAQSLYASFHRHDLVLARIGGAPEGMAQVEAELARLDGGKAALGGAR